MENLSSLKQIFVVNLSMKFVAKLEGFLKYFKVF